MTFAERRRLELDYKEWLKRESIANGVAIKDCPLTVIGFLDSKGLLKKDGKKPKPTCGDCQEWGTVNCPETYREPTKKSDICDSFKAESEG